MTLLEIWLSIVIVGTIIISGLSIALDIAAHNSPDDWIP